MCVFRFQDRPEKQIRQKIVDLKQINAYRLHLKLLMFKIVFACFFFHLLQNRNWRRQWHDAGFALIIVDFFNLLLRFLRAKRIPTREKKKEFFVVKIPLPFVFILAGLINMEPENVLVESVVA